jgi:hypothetical protein
MSSTRSFPTPSEAHPKPYATHHVGTPVSIRRRVVASDAPGSHFLRRSTSRRTAHQSSQRIFFEQAVSQLLRASKISEIILLVVDGDEDDEARYPAGFPVPRLARISAPASSRPASAFHTGGDN